ncbi:MAG: hypothetical protein O6851_10140, partial [Gemmatimonadetes bacterium]|nr:hypothetical protein [Gemmatimonadota bacterium]
SPPAYEERTFPTGTFVVPGAQATRAAILDILARRALPLLYEYDGGPYLRMYDAAAYTVPMQMGVEVARVDDALDIDLEEVTTATAPMPAAVQPARVVYVLNHEINASYTAVNRLLERNLPVYRIDHPVTFQDKMISPGAFAIPASAPHAHSTLQEISTEMRLPVAADPAGLSVTEDTGLRAARIGLYKPWTASMDEGWTRFVLEQFEFPYRSLQNREVRAGNLGQNFDVIIIPAEISLNRLIDGHSPDRMPEEYAGGIGEEGIEELQRFVREGGTLLTFEGADALLLEHFDVPVHNALQGLSQPEYYLPPSLVWIDVDRDHPLAYGLPERLAAKFSGGRAYEPSGWQGVDLALSGTGILRRRAS